MSGHRLNQHAPGTGPFHGAPSRELRAIGVSVPVASVFRAHKLSRIHTHRLRQMKTSGSS